MEVGHPVKVLIKIIPAKSTTITTNVYTSRFKMRVNGNKFVNKSTSSGLFEHFNQPLVIFDDSQNVAIEKDGENSLVA